MTLSKHFSLTEMTVSQEAVRSGLRNAPDALQIESLRLLCQNVLEPLRERVKRPIIISSGFRSTTINRRVGGSSRSQHCRGEAADLNVPGMSVQEVIDLIKKMGLPVDQCIDEFGAWVHVSHSRTKQQRGEYLKARRVGGKTVYSLLGD